ncbi:hypothetical protein QP411_06265 [Pseudoglutamicibacter cumminsii]|uniref:hypothetical protein n=1 Tax=Pseudoglutamicibacter cumminsii TaxID=156979 RepID=UPI0015E8237C|nr:hypothetical protein [Pseudoglutamicibacter cumminsii]MDK7083518.1 hypothetical protein [Pseudoglutamicibacter cumminsii]
MTGPRRRRVASVPPTRLGGKPADLVGSWEADLPTNPALREGVSHVVGPSQRSQDEEEQPGDAALLAERPPHWSGPAS